jgi:hypothetical protein
MSSGECLVRLTERPYLECCVKHEFWDELMDSAIIFDCEFLVSEGAQSRFWCGPFDPDPVVVQVGAVKLALSGDFRITDRFEVLIHPKSRHGVEFVIDPLFTELTGITPEAIASDGVSLQPALDALARFAGEATLWSWGKDELNLMAISCYIAGVTPVISAHRFGNACKLLMEAGMPYEDIKITRSNRLSSYYGVQHPPLRPHNALDDALSVAYVLQHLLRTGKLTRETLLNIG